MKVLILCQNLGVGGAEELIRGMATHLPAQGVEPTIVAITRRGPVAREIERAGGRVLLAPGQPGPRDPRAFLDLVRLIRAERPDVVHTFLLNACLYGRLAAIVARVPVVVAAEQNVYASKARRHIWMERLLASRTYKIVACCDAVGRSYRLQVGVPERRVTVVYNAVELRDRPATLDGPTARRRLGLPSDGPVIGAVGRLAEQKAHSLLVEALAKLAGRVAGVHVVVAGDGPLRPALERQARDLGVANRISFPGVCRDRETLYAAMDLFALPSRWEGLSLALLEAMGAGLPIVATSVGGNPEVVNHGRTGLLVPPGDAHALASALEALIVDRGRAKALGDAARLVARERFTIERHVREIVALYRQGLEERALSRVARLGAGA